MRLALDQRRTAILRALNALHSSAATQAEFTAAKAAAAAGVSKQLLYRVAGAEFIALRDQLPGPRRASDVVLAAARRELVNAHRALRRLEREHARCADIETLEALVTLNEQLDAENRALRSQLTYLTDRLNAEGYLVSVPVPADIPAPIDLDAHRQQRDPEA